MRRPPQIIEAAGRRAASRSRHAALRDLARAAELTPDGEAKAGAPSPPRMPPPKQARGRGSGALAVAARPPQRERSPASACICKASSRPGGRTGKSGRRSSLGGAAPSAGADDPERAAALASYRRRNPGHTEVRPGTHADQPPSGSRAAHRARRVRRRSSPTSHAATRSVWGRPVRGRPLLEGGRAELVDQDDPDQLQMAGEALFSAGDDDAALDLTASRRSGLARERARSAR